ncbi:hypothetical protein FGADI_1063 [Fusarium gaditjirri]|uniref:Uncharacterized protein n=1 Tax=Fusarium gaditjirri TaxID=282569 RepID=A0A8H4TM39_9HYPO|nr:hypothetical protein FGADI_1063 [Fusarium gaditjirri]
MFSFFTTKKTVVRNRELGPGGIHLKDYGIPGLTNLVEALSDMGTEDDRVSDFDENDDWVDLETQKNIIKSTLQPKSDVKVTVKANGEMINELQACIIDDYWTNEGIQRREMEAIQRQSMQAAKSCVSNWLKGVTKVEADSDSSSDYQYSLSSKESSPAKANFYRLPELETFQKTKFNAPVFGDETRLTAYNDRILSSVVCWGKVGEEESDYDSEDEMLAFSKHEN